MPRKWTGLLAAVAVLLTSVCLWMSIGKTQARCLSETNWEMMLAPKVEESESGFLRSDGQTVLLADWDLSTEREQRELSLGLAGDTLTATVESPAYLQAEIVESNLVLKLLEDGEAPTQRQVVTVHVEHDDLKIWADFRVTLIPPDILQAQVQEQESEIGGQTGPVTGWMEHFDPQGWLLVKLAVPSGVDRISVSQAGERFPARTRYVLDGEAYMLYEAQELSLDVTAKSTVNLLFDFSETEWNRDDSSGIMMKFECRSGNGASLAEQTITVHADAVLPALPEGAPVVSEKRPLRLEMAHWQLSGCQWEAAFEFLTRRADGTLSYEPLVEASAFTLTAKEDCLCVSLGAGEEVSAGSYRMILKLKYGEDTVYEQTIPFFANHYSGAEHPER